MPRYSEESELVFENFVVSSRASEMLTWTYIDLLSDIVCMQRLAARRHTVKSCLCVCVCVCACASVSLHFGGCLIECELTIMWAQSKIQSFFGEEGGEWLVTACGASSAQAPRSHKCAPDISKLAPQPFAGVPRPPMASIFYGRHGMPMALPGLRMLPMAFAWMPMVATMLWSRRGESAL